MLCTPANAFVDFFKLSPNSISLFLKENNLVLTSDEILKIQKDILKRPPTFTELILWSIQGSEHCSYKSSRHYLKTLPTQAPHVILGPKEDAGIVAVATDNAGNRYGIVMSHESHNHPSQTVPYEGAATGVGGNVRDVSCMGADVIALANGLRFGALQNQKTHWVHEGVVAGIAGYGNPIGVPMIAGDLYYDSSYNNNCLVTIVTLGIVKEQDIIHSYAPQNADNHVFILVGKPTDKSGFGGASFASTDLLQEEFERNKGAVQEPNAFLKRHLLKANKALFNILKEKNLLNRVGFKDLGAGGIACASVELADAAGYGAEITLDLVPTQMNGLHPSVVLCSETQERFMWIVPSDLVHLILTHYNETFELPQISFGAQAAVIGKIRTDGQYVVRYQNEILVDAKASDVTRGIQYQRPVKPLLKLNTEPDILPPADYNEVFLKLLSHENIASRQPVFEKFDKQVQGRTVIEAGDADAGVLQPFNDDSFPDEIRKTGIALSVDQNPRYNQIDPYWGAIHAVVESARNVAATGATPLAITDCLCFGNPEKPEQMWQFSESVRGIAAACHAIGMEQYSGTPLPVISGNVSFYNESNGDSIAPSPMISCLGALPDVSFSLTKNFQHIDSELWLIGERLDECGGSVYYDLLGHIGTHIPRPNLNTIGSEIYAVTSVIQSGLVCSAHDISDGGLAIALVEMSFKNNIGCCVMIPGDLRTDKKLFSESGGFILEISSKNTQKFQKVFEHYKVPVAYLGRTTKAQFLSISNEIYLSIEQAKSAWSNGLREKLI